MEPADDLYSQRYGLSASGSLGVLDPLPEAVRTILSHCSLRKFSSEPVPAPLVELLMACAQSAPTKSNLQQYSVLQLNDAHKRERLAEMLGRTAWAMEAPLFLFFLGDLRRNRRISALRGYDYSNNNADSFMNAAVDAALAMQNFITAAEAMGLGCCPISAIRERLDEVAALLELPEGVFPISGLAAGYPASETKPALRLPQSLVVHQDRYDDSSFEQDLAAYDDRVFEVAPIPVEKQRHVDRYGPVARGVWSENVARQLSLPERAGFKAWLAGHAIKLD